VKQYEDSNLILTINILLILTSSLVTISIVAIVNLSPIIRELLLHNEKLVIPGFGALITLNHPAAINKATNILVPPSKEILFDARQKYDDGQLAAIIMKRFKLSETEAMEAISNFVHSLEEQINTQGTALIEGIGNLNKGQSGNLAFQPHADFLNLTGVFGLTKFEIPVPASSNPPEVRERIPEPSNIEEKGERRKWWIPAAILLVLTGLFSLVYFTGLFNRFVTAENRNKNGLKVSENPDRIVFGGRTPAEKDTMQEMISKQLDESTTRGRALSYEKSQNKPAEITTPEIVPQVKESAIKRGTYHIIAGAFLVPNNAERQKIKLEKNGFFPILLPPKGDYIMVSLGSYESREQAIAAMKLLREKTKIELWVMKI